MIKPKDSSPTIMIPVSAENGDWSTCNYAVIFFTKEIVADIIKKKNLLVSNQQQELDLISMKYTIPSGVHYIDTDYEHDIGISDDIYDDNEIKVTDKMFDDLKNGQFVFIEVDEALADKCNTRIDGDYMIVSESGVQFYCNIKHCNTPHYTNTIWWKEFESIVFRTKTNSVKFIEGD